MGSRSTHTRQKPKQSQRQAAEKHKATPQYLAISIFMYKFYGAGLDVIT